MLVQECRDAAVLAGIELVEAIHREHEIAFGNPEARFELAGVFQLVDVDLDCSCDRLHVGGVVAEMIEAWRVVEAPHHIDATAGQDVVPVVKVVLLGRKHRDLRPRLLPRVRRVGVVWSA